MHWAYDPLWQKAKVYADRAIGERRDSSLFAFWCSLTIEFVARSTLARIHPALLADPRGDESVLYACGYPAERPLSISMRTVLSRCKAIVPALSDSEVRSARILIERRNAELHTGENAFADLPTSLWLADFFSVCDKLLTHQGQSLESLFGTEEAKAANQMLEVADELVLNDAKKRHGIALAAFKKKTVRERQKLKAAGSSTSKRQLTSRGLLVTCPACGALALVSGELIAESSPRLEGEEIVQDETVLPTRLECYSCKLILPTHGALHALGLGGQFRTEWRSDASDYYSAQIDPADFFEPEYGND